MSLADTIALTTLAIVKDDLGITDTSSDTRLERMILQASEAIGRYCNRTFRKASATDKLRPNGLRKLVLAQTPLVSLTSMLDDTSAVDITTWSIEDAGAGVILCTSPTIPNDPPVPWSIGRDPLMGLGTRSLSVTYIGGYVLPNDSTGTVNLPYDLRAAAGITACSLFRSRGADRRIASESLGDASVSYGGVNTAIGRGAGGIIPDDALPMLAPYRRIVMA